MANPAVQVSIPSELAFALKIREGELAREVLRLTLVKLFELGKVSSGLAAKMLGLNRVQFLDLAAAYQVSVLGSPEIGQIQRDFENA